LTRREILLEGLEGMLPKLLRQLEITAKSPEFDIDDVDELYRYLSKGHEPGDAIIWLKMRKAGLNTIATDDVATGSPWGECRISNLRAFSAKGLRVNIDLTISHGSWTPKS
jgi:hypothetical protein